MGGIERDKLDFQTAMKAYGISCSILAGLIGALLLSLSETKGVEPYLIYIGATVGSFFIPGSKLKKSMIQRDRMIKREFPKIIDQTIILLEAGYSMAMVWRHFNRELEGKGSSKSRAEKAGRAFLGRKGRGRNLSRNDKKLKFKNCG